VLWRTTVKRKVAGSIIVPEDFYPTLFALMGYDKFLGCIQLTCNRRLCRKPERRNPGEGVQLGRNTREVTQMKSNALPLRTCYSDQANLAAIGGIKLLCFTKSEGGGGLRLRSGKTHSATKTTEDCDDLDNPHSDFRNCDAGFESGRSIPGSIFWGLGNFQGGGQRETLANSEDNTETPQPISLWWMECVSRQ
jgi:hypothetical protein